MSREDGATLDAWGWLAPAVPDGRVGVAGLVLVVVAGDELAAFGRVAEWLGLPGAVVAG